MRFLQTSIVLFLFVALVSFGCHKSVSAPPVVTATPPPTPLPPTIALIADRVTITEGEAVTLTWQSTNATTVLLDNSIGNVSANGTRRVSPRTSTSYTAIAQGAGGMATSSAVRIAVNVVQAPPQRAQAPRSTGTVRQPSLAEQFQAAMQNILFDYDRASIRVNEIPKLEAAAKWLIANKSVQLTIEGNADERGGQEYNIALGDERAGAVKKYLMDHGVLESRLGALSYGEERPLCREESDDCWQKNRRAQFTMKP